jgi:hypothetical protein
VSSECRKDGRWQASRRKISPFTGQHRDEDFIVRGNLTHLLREVVVLLLRQRIELLVVVDGQDRDPAAVLKRHDGLVWRRHCES